MTLVLQCITACIIFTIIILSPLYKNPLTQIMSYPTSIRKRVEELPKYSSEIKSVQRSHIIRKVLALFIFSFILAIVAYLSEAKTFSSAFQHVFILSFTVNIYDVLVLDIGLFCHDKKVIIPGTEDMIEEYKNPWHHIRGALIGAVVGVVVSILAGPFVYGYNLILL